MYKQYLKQAWQLMKQNRFFSTVYIIGTGLAISMVMAIAVVYHIRTANIAPEVSRDRMGYVSNVSYEFNGGKGSLNSGCGPRFVKEVLYGLETPEKVAVTTNAANGYASATQNGVQVDDDGKVYATYSNGERMLQGQVVLATFPNENGLEAVSGTAWVQTGESGTPLIGVPGSGTCGTLSSGVLESSNVDITSELVNLMTAQRNYQANTKVIATSTQLDDALFQAM